MRRFEVHVTPAELAELRRVRDQVEQEAQWNGRPPARAADMAGLAALDTLGARARQARDLARLGVPCQVAFILEGDQP